jgi:hypothetical protein
MTSIRVNVITTALLSGALAAVQPLSAQQPPSLAPGQRVRITAPSAGLNRTAGTVWAVRGRQIILEPDSPRPAWGRSGFQADSLDVAVSLDSVRALEVSVGRHGHAGVGAVIGAAIVGTGFGISAGSCTGFLCPSPGAVAAVGGFLGGLIGGLVGSGIVTDDWSNVPLGGARIGLIAPRGRRLGLGASLVL